MVRTSSTTSQTTFGSILNLNEPFPSNSLHHRFHKFTGVTSPPVVIWAGDQHNKLIENQIMGMDEVNTNIVELFFGCLPWPLKHLL